jgi:hypothetical protein
MKALTLEIKPLKGLGELTFGMTEQQVIDYLGIPDEKELLDDFDESDDEQTLIYHFDNYDISAFFEGKGDEKRLVNIETGNHEATLFGKSIFVMPEADIIKLMKENKFADMDDEMLEDEEYQNEKRVSFDDAMMDFFFEDEILIAVSWGNFFSDEEEA